MLVFRNRKLRQRPGNVPVRVLRPRKTRWMRGHALWVSDVFAWRGSPAAWNEDLQQVDGVSIRPANAQEQKKLRRLDDNPVIASLTLAGGESLDVAVRPEHRSALAGPFVDTAEAA